MDDDRSGLEYVRIDIMFPRDDVGDLGVHPIET
jgi:hypothetical protein